MSLIETVKTIKSIHIEDLILIKIGKFIYAYGKDACIISYLFNYRIKLIENNIYVCAFPNNNVNKIIATLEQRKINYKILDKRRNMEIDEEVSFKNLNKYNNIVEQSVKYVKRNNQVDNIYQRLLKEINEENFEEIVSSVRKVLSEGRKI